MPDRRDELCSALMGAAGLTREKADGLLSLLVERECLELEPDPSDPSRTVVLSHDAGGAQAVSYKPHNLVFNLKNAALSAGIGAIEAYLGADGLAGGGSAGAYIVLLCLKTLSGMKAELSPPDAELIEFLWRERLHRRLNADDEYEAFRRYMDGRGGRPPTNLEYHQSLDRLAELDTLRLEEGMILLREKVVVKGRI